VLGIKERINGKIEVRNGSLSPKYMENSFSRVKIGHFLLLKVYIGNITGRFPLTPMPGPNVTFTIADGYFYMASQHPD